MPVKPAGLSKIFAFIFVFTMAAQPVSVFGMPKAPIPIENSTSPSSPSSIERRFYAVSFNSQTRSQVVLASRQEILNATRSSSFNAQISVADFIGFYPELKVVALDFSRVKISVIDRLSQAVVLKVLPISLLGYFGMAEKKSSASPAPGVLTAPLAADRVKEKADGLADEGTAYMNSFFDAFVDFSPQSTLILRC